MCIIVTRAIDARKITRAEWERMARGNSDGYGLMYHDGQKVCTYHTMDAEKWISAGEVLEQHNVAFAAHARITTHGKTNEYNCHPFQTTPGTYLMHNGILNIAPIGERSDTRTFAEYVLANMPDDWSNNPGLVFLVEQYAKQHHSKFVVMDTDGVIRIMNATAGIYEDDKRLWFSNGSYKSYGISADPRHSGRYGSIHDSGGAFPHARGSLPASSWQEEEGGSWSRTVPGRKGAPVDDRAYEEARYPGLSDGKAGLFDDMTDPVEDVDEESTGPTGRLVDQYGFDLPPGHQLSIAEQRGLGRDSIVAMEVYGTKLGTDMVCLNCVKQYGYTPVECEAVACYEVRGQSCDLCDTLLVTDTGDELL